MCLLVGLCFRKLFVAVFQLGGDYLMHSQLLEGLKCESK